MSRALNSRGGVFHGAGPFREAMRAIPANGLVFRPLPPFPVGFTMGP